MSKITQGIVKKTSTLWRQELQLASINSPEKSLSHSHVSGITQANLCFKTADKTKSNPTAYAIVSLKNLRSNLSGE